ncbi:hypothetical protein [Capnocytophaga sp.]|uniref:hypothetical protein n=1 Tax=Capnocytophaga sp. TaxID=44737 RepID=UPI0026DBA6BE|nr:hypothetical protein [Capnocytophaga sp.]MDO5104326.1 hypothetical protein [Capnocytophaga sp.]
MKKSFTFLFSVLLTIVSCSKGNNSDDTPPPVVTDPDTFEVTIDDVFNHPYKNLTNIQVGDYIPFAIEITDTQDNASYSLLLLKEGEKNHQTLGRDYELYIDNERGEKQKMDIQKNDALNYVVFDKKGKHYFYIKPLTPGTFLHAYELQKQIKGKPVGNNIRKELLFNAVQIKAWAVREGSWGIPFRSKYKRNFYFKINDGEDQDDVYLTSNDQMSQRYLVTYEGKEYAGAFNQGDIRYIADREYERSVENLSNTTISTIRITQNRTNKSEDFIEYHNIHIEEIKQ